MSLLLDALNRASKEKAVSAAEARTAPDAAAGAGAQTHAFADRPAVTPTSDPTSQAAWPDLSLSEAPEPRPVSPPAVDAAPVADTAELAVTPKPSSLVAPDAPAAPTSPLPVHAPPAPELTLTPPTPRETAPAPSNTPSNTPPVDSARASTAAPDATRVAQDIVRAKAPPNRTKLPARLVALAAIAVLLGAGLASIWAGWLGAPLEMMQPPSAISVPAPPVAVVAVAADMPVGSASEQVATTESPAPQAPPPGLNAAVPAPVPLVPAPSLLADAKPPVPKPARARAPAKQLPAAAPRRDQVVPAASQVATATRPATNTANTPPDSGTVERRTPGPSQLEIAYADLTHGRFAQASQAYMQVLAASPEEPQALLGLAYIAHRQQREDDAVALYLRALRQQPGNPVAQAGLAALRRADDTQEIGSRSRDVAELNPTSAAAQSLLGHSLVRESRLGEAEQAFFQAHRLAPTVAVHAFNLAVALDRMRNYGPARRYYEAALALSVRQGGERVSSVPHGVVETRLGQLRAAPKADTVNAD